MFMAFFPSLLSEGLKSFGKKLFEQLSFWSWNTAKQVFSGEWVKNSSEIKYCICNTVYL